MGSRTRPRRRTQANVPVIMGSGNYTLINLLVPGKVIDWVVKQAASELVNLKKDDYEEPSEFISNWSDQSLFLFCLVFK